MARKRRVAQKGRVWLLGTDLDGRAYSEGFNSYYLAVRRKAELTKMGYELIIEDRDENVVSIGSPQRMQVKYNRQEKDSIEKLKPRHRVRVYKANFK